MTLRLRNNVCDATNAAIVLAFIGYALLGGSGPTSASGAKAADATVAAFPFVDGYDRAVDSQRGLRYFSALDKTHFQDTTKLLAHFSDAFNKTLDVTQPKWQITVILPTADDYRKLPIDNRVVGFYNYPHRTLVSLDRGRVLLHEFTHALHHGDARNSGQRHAIWVCEGLASLFEASRIESDGLKPKVDVRLLTLQRAIQADKAIPLAKLLAMDQKEFHKQANLCYAQARYLMLYLHQNKKLAQWYRAYKADFANDPTGKAALRKTLGKRMRVIDKQWQIWVQTLQLPWGERRSGQARLGIHLQDTGRGVRVAGFVKGSAAERAGRIHKGDLLLKIDGRKVANTAEAVGAIRKAGAMQTITIELKRQGRLMTVRQPLGAPKNI